MITPHDDMQYIINNISLGTETLAGTTVGPIGPHPARRGGHISARVLAKASCVESLLIMVIYASHGVGHTLSIA